MNNETKPECWEELYELGALFSFPHNAINAKAEIPQRDGVPMLYNGMDVTKDIKDIVSKAISKAKEDERDRLVEEIEKKVIEEMWSHHSFNPSFAKDNGINTRLENHLNDMMLTAHNNGLEVVLKSLTKTDSIKS
jgi:hypothetical protein